MSILKSLKLTTAEPVRASNDPIQRARQKVIGALAEQRLMAEAKIAGQHYAPTHTMWRKNPEGQRVQVKPRNAFGPGEFGAVDFAPLAVSAKTFSAPDEASASRCASSVWPSVDTRA